MSEPEHDVAERDDIEHDGIERDAIDSAGADADALASRLRVIEEQPLPGRADAFARVHDELRTRLETGGSPSA
jgi:hypothetical protein